MPREEGPFTKAALEAGYTALGASLLAVRHMGMLRQKASKEGLLRALSHELQVPLRFVGEVREKARC